MPYNKGMKHVVAVSGGVDSVVLLDMLVKKGVHELVVAHFDHGIRSESDADARFVWALAQRYGLPCEVRREELGSRASEAMARTRRYAFLEDMAAKYDATILTAHHQDDVVETIAINLARGTGWRGLAVFGRSDVQRPLLGYRKKELYDYALARGLEWVEDETNANDTYLRNRVRRQISRLSDDDRKNLLAIYASQAQLRTKIDREVARLQRNVPSRYFMTMISENVAIELLRAATNGCATRPQLRRLWLAIKTAQPGTDMTVNGEITAHFAQRTVSLEIR